MNDRACTYCYRLGHIRSLVICMHDKPVSCCNSFHPTVNQADMLEARELRIIRLAREMYGSGSQTDQERWQQAMNSARMVIELEDQGHFSPDKKTISLTDNSNELKLPLSLDSDGKSGELPADDFQ